MIGKIFRAFSNDWKKFSAQGESKGSARGKRKERKGGDAKNAKAGGGRETNRARLVTWEVRLSVAPFRLQSIAFGRRGGCWTGGHGCPEFSAWDGWEWSLDICPAQVL